MRKMVKIIGGSICAIAIIICILIVIIFINHKINLLKENKQFLPIGQMVNVNGHYMHIYSEGEGDIPLVFMSGGGTSSPTLDFKSLYSLLSDNYKIVVVEKLGYGFSDIVDTPRDIDSILNDTRQALALANIKGPYILFPHSMSGIEALYWAQLYPEEVNGIVGLDMAVPKAYENYKINIPMIKIGSIASNLGITRLIPNLSESDAIKYGTLTDDEKKLYKTIFYRRTATYTMINEVLEVKNNAKKVSENSLPNIPILMFVSNGVGTGWNERDWINIQETALKEFKNGEIVHLDCSHYIHDIEYKKIAKDATNFIEKIKK
ncbi:alpha/beta hydrolase [Paraclostridium ghonii]|uniref:alpha/beta hydrolase n=1 Tax=Paraclostridium ghonii TaxID=29358 RepID=UPI00202CB605|nr:alpha/beta hydrolase [Paeniclostridium ghonii]MCM0167555.1 alpha/beta hydrolase [Paeniclostridium ghonii]